MSFKPQITFQDVYPLDDMEQKEPIITSAYISWVPFNALDVYKMAWRELSLEFRLDIRHGVDNLPFEIEKNFRESSTIELKHTNEQQVPERLVVSPSDLQNSNTTGNRLSADIQTFVRRCCHSAEAICTMPPDKRDKHEELLKKYAEEQAL